MFNELINSIPEDDLEKTIVGILDMFDDETIRQTAQNPHHYLHKYLFLLEPELQTRFVEFLEETFEFAEELKKAVDNGFDITTVPVDMTYEEFKKLGFPL